MSKNHDVSKDYQSSLDLPSSKKRSLSKMKTGSITTYTPYANKDIFNRSTCGEVTKTPISEDFSSQSANRVGPF